MSAAEGYYPPVGFAFRVDVDGIQGVNEGSFQEVSGLSVKISPKAIEEGGENGFTHRFPTPPQYENLVLKRGMLIGSPLITWARTSIEQFTFEPKVVNLFLLNELAEPLSSWRFMNAYPVGIKVSDFNAKEGALVVETLELCFDYFVKVS